MEETWPFTVPFWSASGVSDCGMATGIPPKFLMMSACVPPTLNSSPFKSFRDFTGLMVIIFAGGQVNSVIIFT